MIPNHLRSTISSFLHVALGLPLPPAPYKLAINFNIPFYNCLHLHWSTDPTSPPTAPPSLPHTHNHVTTRWVMTFHYISHGLPSRWLSHDKFCPCALSPSDRGQYAYNVCFSIALCRHCCVASDSPKLASCHYVCCVQLRRPTTTLVPANKCLANFCTLHRSPTILIKYLISSSQQNCCSSFFSFTIRSCLDILYLPYFVHDIEILKLDNASCVVVAPFIALQWAGLFSFCFQLGNLPRRRQTTFPSLFFFSLFFCLRIFDGF